MTTLVDLLEPLAACGFLRQVTRLCVVSKELKLAAPMGTGRQVYEAAGEGDAEALTSYLAWWRGNRESYEVLDWSGDVTGFGLGITPLLAAVRNGRVECVQLLADESLVVDVDKGMNPPLNLASQKGNAAIVAILLAVKGIDVNNISRLQDHNTSLHSAARYNHPEVARLLVAAKGIKLELKDHAFETPLAVALRLKHDEVAAIILSAIEAKEVLDAKGKALYDAADKNEIDTLRLLLDKWSGDENVLNWYNNPNRYTPLLAACQRGHIQAVRLLASTPGVDVNEADFDDYTPLIRSSFHGYTEIARYLLTECPAVDINKEYGDGCNALMMATEEECEKIVDLLLADKRLRNVNKVSEISGCTPLLNAALYGRDKIVRSLLAYEGIDVNVKATVGQYRGKSALSLAISDGNSEIAALLRAAGATEPPIHPRLLD